MSANKNFKIKTAVLTISDKGSRGERKDLSGPIIKDMMEEIGAVIVYEEIIADEISEIKKVLAERKKDWVKPELKFNSGTLGLYVRHAVPAAKGAYIGLE